MVLVALVATVGAPLAMFGWLLVVEHVTGMVPARHRRRAQAIGWLLPGTAVAAIYLLWPLLWTFALSFRDATGTSWIGVDNYRFLLSSEDVRGALQNNLLWLVGLVTVPVAIGLLVAVLADSARFESAAKAIVVTPIAISFVAAAIVWRAMFAYQPANRPQTSTLNAALGIVGVDPLAWLIDGRTNNAALIAVGVWMTAGFATVVLSAGLKAVPLELLDAAQVDGATSWQLVRLVIVPQLRPLLVVVATAMAITALKAFDVVYTMTSGRFGTNVIANVLYQQLFIAQHDGRASAVAVLLCVVAAPIVVLNVRAGRRTGR